MKSVDFLYVALAATAAIHAVYIATLVRRYKTLQCRMKELEKNAAK